MTITKEQIAQHTYAETTQQQIPDDPLAPVPIRFTHQRIVNGQAFGWHLEDDAEASDAEPSPHRGQASPPSRQTRDYRQQAQVTQAYAPDYEDAATKYTAQAPAPRSAMRYQHLTGNAPGQQQQPPTRRSRLWSLYLVTGMLATAALFAGLQSLGAWWQGVQDHWTYGMPRMYQTSAVVGHNHDSSSHPSQFLALNLRGQVEVFELPAGDPTKVRVFLGPLLSGNGADQVVVTISFTDLDHDGTPDMVIRYGDSAEVLYNKGGTFLLPGSKSSAQGRSVLS